MLRAGLLLLLAAVAGAEELRPLDGYRTIMWIGPSAYEKPGKFPLFLQRLREMGVNTGMIQHDGDAQPFRDAGFPFYLENVVNRGLCLKFSSNVRDWDQFVTGWRAERADSALIRDYSLDDPVWRESQRKEVRYAAKKFAPDRPILLDLRDELSVTQSANPFDYDFSPTALAGFRAWLKTEYADLAALNTGWHTDFKTWDDVRPFTTDQIKNRLSGGLGHGQDGAGFPRGKPDWQALAKITFDPVEARKDPLRWNFSPWCDHRTYMDLSLARALDDFRQTARALDPGLPVGIEGTQMPAAFGGYDLWRLSQVLDWIEPYDIGNAREILGSFMPGKPFLTTVGEQDAREARRRLWHLLLEGDAGCIVWWSEDCIDWKSDDYALTPRAQALAPVLKEMQGPLATLFRRAKRETDPIAIHYSQASIQVNWLLESCRDGGSWVKRYSSYEASANQMLQRRQAWVKLLQDAGYTPVFVSTEQIERGELEKYRVFVACESTALSEKERAAVSRLNQSRRRPLLMVSSGYFAEFDGRGRFLPGKPPGKIFRNEVDRTLDMILELPEPDQGTSTMIRGTTTYLKDRAIPALAPTQYVVRSLHQTVAPSVRVPREACVRVHRYRLGGGPEVSPLRAKGAGGARLLAFERNIVWQMGEDLKQHGGNEALEKPAEFTAALAQAGHVYDVRTGEYLGKTDQIKVALDPWEPSLYAVAEEKIDGDVVEFLAR